MGKSNPSGHPARFNDKLIPVFSKFLPLTGKLIDSFAGTAEKLAMLLEDNHFLGEIHANELQPYWASFTPEPIISVVGDACNLPYPEEFFNCALTSPCYGNRMADSHTPQEDSPRNTYTHRHMAHCHGEKLDPRNSGAMQWGPEYRKLHLHAWVELWRVLKRGAPFILNIKDHIRAGKRVHVTHWHIETIQRIGFRFDGSRKVFLSGNRQGENAEKRINYEKVIRFVKTS
jgi:hypothetical protein